MQGFTQTKNTSRRFIWLSAGLCFVLLYSCPVRKYLLMTVAGAHATESPASSFEKDLSSYNARIVYLSRRSSGQPVITLIRAARPVLPLPFAAFVTGFSQATDTHAVNTLSARRQARNEGRPPGWTPPLRI
jgi:hypothetical protein